ncbi:MAG: M48 family metalloprotease [Alphaproteobacteria bacterium]|nr:M48 family metalloprotease [Alphaproteobacteria bacterium]
MKRLPAALCLIAAMVSAPPEAVSQPAPMRERPAADTDEGGLWGLFDRAEIAARSSGELIDAAALNEYIREVTCRVASDVCGDIRIYVMNRPFINATMAPNGYAEVWSGLLLRAQNEAELAFILGHEVAHYEQRHSLARLRRARNASTASLVLGVGLAVAGSGAAANNPAMASDILDLTGHLIDIVYLGAVAYYFGFSRENEGDADAIGAERAIGAGYDPFAGARLWQNLISERETSDFERTRRQEARASIFNTHPLTSDRVAALEALARAAPQSGQTERARYRAAIRPHLDPWLRDDLRRRDYGQTLFVIDRLAEAGEDLGVLNHYRGESYRLRRGDGDLGRARAAYEEAIRHPDAPPLAWRQLGEIYERERRPADAAAHLRTYLEKMPGASDRLLVERRMTALETQAGTGSQGP